MIGENFVIGSARSYMVWLYIKILLMCFNVLPGTMAWGHDQCCGRHLVTLKGDQENFQNCMLHKCYSYMIESLIPGPAYFSTFYDMKLLNVFFFLKKWLLWNHYKTDSWGKTFSILWTLNVHFHSVMINKTSIHWWEQGLERNSYSKIIL